MLHLLSHSPVSHQCLPFPSPLHYPSPSLSINLSSLLFYHYPPVPSHSFSGPSSTSYPLLMTLLCDHLPFSSSPSFTSIILHFHPSVFRSLCSPFMDPNSVHAYHSPTCITHFAHRYSAPSILLPQPAFSSSSIHLLHHLHLL